MSITTINAVFGKERLAITEPLYMYDVGITLSLHGVPCLPEYFTAYFANEVEGTAIEVLGHDGDAAIPNILLTTGLPVYCWVYIVESAAQARTMYVSKTPVRQRARSESDTTPAQETAVAAAIAALNASSAQVAQVAATAQQVDMIIRSTPAGRVTSLDSTVFAMGYGIDVSGIPVYVEDVTQYSSFSGLTDPGWYIFARITPPEGMTPENPAVSWLQEDEVATRFGANGSYIDLAIRFEVAAQSKVITITWKAGVSSTAETFIFRADDLAIRNLDYRTTFYVYDIDEFATWTMGVTADAAFKAGKTYYLLEDDEYTAAEVTAGETIPVYYVDRYALTEDAAFAEGKTYYTFDGSAYSEAVVTAGADVQANIYYEHAYVRTEDAAFVSGKTYYTVSEGEYTAAEVTAGEDVPPAYYEHTKLTFEGMTRNVTYRFNQLVDAPIEIIMPEIEDDGYGAWFEIQMQYDTSHSCTLVMPSDDVKAGTAQTQAQTKGINVMDLHYTNVNGRKTWTLINTHSNLPSEGGA